MKFRSAPSPLLLPLTLLLAGSAFLNASAIAHTVEVAEDVAATLHIEPNDTPIPGKPATAWFALTRKGGDLIPLEQCDCSLKIYSEPSKPGDAPVLQPPLKPLDSTQFQGLPGSEINFPKPGRYRLELSGRPKGAVQFKPFDLRYEVTVAAGASAPSPEASSQAVPGSAAPKAASQTATPTEAQDFTVNLWQPLLVIAAGALGLTIVLSLINRRREP